MKLDAETVNKINKLAATLRNTGLANTTTEAVEKAKEIVLGKVAEDSPDEIEKEVEQVEKDLEDDLKAGNIYFTDGTEREQELDSMKDSPVEEEAAGEVAPDPVEEATNDDSEESVHDTQDEQEDEFKDDLAEGDGLDPEKKEDGSVVIAEEDAEDSGKVQPEDLQGADEEDLVVPKPEEPIDDDSKSGPDDDLDLDDEEKTVQELFEEDNKKKKDSDKED